MKRNKAFRTRKHKNLKIKTKAPARYIPDQRTSKLSSFCQKPTRLRQSKERRHLSQKLPGDD